MKNVNPMDRKKRGVALIISVGVLALVAMIATSFAINMQMEYRAAANFYNYSIASEIAEGATQIPIADIRNWVQTVKYQTVLDNIKNNYSAPPEVVIAGTSNTYQVTVQREDATADGTLELINVNTMDETDYPWIDRLKDAGISYDDIARIIDYRDEDSNNLANLLTKTAVGAHVGLWVQPVDGGESYPTNAKNAPYATLEEVKLALNDEAKYNKIKDIITISSPIIRGGLIGKYYSSRPTFDSSTILNVANFRGKVVELGRRCQSWGPGNTFPGADGSWWGWSEAHDAEWQGGYIAVDWDVGAGLEQFGVVFTGYLYVPQASINQNIQFWVTSRDGARFFIDGNQITATWTTVSSNNEQNGNMTLTRAGWHPIRIEYYNEANENVLFVEWNALGSRNYIPAENFGYCPTSFYGKIYDYTAKKFIMEDGLAPTTAGNQYDQAGVVRITATGRVYRPDGTTLLAQKQVVSTVRIFGTWTQTTKPEFSAAWNTDYYFPGNSSGGSGYSAGQIRNVNWMDSCPTDEDQYDGNTHKMHWEGNYTTVPDSLKLGFWCNFDEDVGYSFIMLRGDIFTAQNGVDSYLPDTLWDSCSFNEMAAREGAVDSSGLNSTYCLKLDAKGNSGGFLPEERTAAINGYYYFPVPDQSGHDDMFVRSYIQDKGQYYTGSIYWDYADTWRDESMNTPVVQPPIGPALATSVPPAVPAAPFSATYLIAKCPPYTHTGQAHTYPDYHVLLKDNDTDFFWGGGIEEFWVRDNSPKFNNFSVPYSKDITTGKTNPHVLAEIWQNTTLCGFGYSYVTDNGAVTNATGFTAGSFNTMNVPSDLATDPLPPNDPEVVKFSCRNTYSYSLADDWDQPFLDKITAANGYFWGCSSELVGIIDDVRVIYPSGFLASTPFPAKSSDDNANIAWGAVSWHSDEPSGTSVAVGIRAADSLSRDDTGWQMEANNALLSGFSGRNIQYKVTLSTANLASCRLDTTAAGYPAASSTPVFRDITVTYLPPVEFLYRHY